MQNIIYKEIEKYVHINDNKIDIMHLMSANSQTIFEQEYKLILSAGFIARLSLMRMAAK